MIGGAKKTILIVVVGLVLIAGVILLIRRKRQETGVDSETGELRGCVSVPPTFSRWSGNFSGVDWGEYGKQLRDRLQVNSDNESERTYVEGFFKAIDVEPRAAYVRYFEEDLKIWLRSSNALPHYEVAKGMLRCNK